MSVCGHDLHDVVDAACQTGDVVGLLDVLGEYQAVVVGHDWGALVAWYTALLHPNRVRAVAALSVAWTGRTPCPFCNSVLHTLHFDVSWWLRPRMDDGRLIIGVPCTRCDPWTPRNVFDVTGASAQQLLRRALAYQHVTGASERDVSQATKLLDADPVVRRIAAQDLIIMGLAARDYLMDQRAQATPELREAIDRVWRQIQKNGW